MGKKIFLSVSNGPNCAYIIQEFRKIGYTVYSGDMNENSIGKILADHFFVLPPQDSEEYFPEIFRIIKEERIDYFVPLLELESLEASKMRQSFSELGCTLVAANTKTLEYAYDKALLYDYLTESHEIPFLNYRVVNNYEEFVSGCSELGEDRLCIKPATGSGSRGFVILDRKPVDAMNLFHSKMEFHHLPFDYMGKILRESSTIPKLLLMEYLDDVHYDSNIICKDGKILFQSIKTREEAKIGTITKGTVVRNPEIEAINHKIVSALNTTGLIATQFIGNKLIEINPRWSTSLNYDGINEFLMSVNISEGKEVSVNDAIKEDYYGVKMLRYWDLAVYK